MGQYHYIANLDKKEYLHPHNFGDGLKLLEFGCSGNGTMTGLAILLANSTNRDEPEAAIIGSWAGDRIVIQGNYADPEVRAYAEGLYEKDSDWKNISDEVIRALLLDRYLRGKFLNKSTTYSFGFGVNPKFFTTEEVEQRRAELERLGNKPNRGSVSRPDIVMGADPVSEN